ncbi:hypothetical protein [Paenibacillus thermotolerans]|uniref:hypothetical protein n=1 Tax=Paenibacillus thermotolerans TaxID=3027807 RepID=UPI0023680763|nr:MULTISPECIES: hypothetical protein [unclassified Paenibacillus]
MHLIIPAAGKSSRFPNMRPKWMLTHPNGQLMVTEAIKGLPLEEFESVTLVTLKKQMEQYGCLDGIRAAFHNEFPKLKLRILQLDEATQSQPETVAQAIERMGLTGPIFIKDTDNYFETTLRTDNFVCTYRLEQTTCINPGNKSYVTVNDDGYLDNIAEKQMISSAFCVGGYGFESAEQFVSYFKQMENSNDLYISHLIYAMMLDDIRFHEVPASLYHDWGTLKDWERHKQGFATLFIDLDGVLVYNSSQYMKPSWGESAAIQSNVEFINRLYETGKVQIIITTSRSKKFKRSTIEQLKQAGIKYNDILFGLNHAKRIIINDYSATNPYPSCIALNMKRDSQELRELLLRYL